MSGISSSASGSSSTFGTNVAPISFPGIASGIDYNSIIQKYTSMTTQQETPLQNQVSSLNKQQAELLKIQDLLSRFQDAFTAVSDPANFTATAATASQSGMATFSDVAGQAASSGTFVINKVRLATATEITSSASAGAPLTMTAPLSQAGFQITPKDGSSSSGTPAPASLTIDGVQITNIDVNSATPQSLLNAINSNAQLQALGVSASFNADGTFSIAQTSTSQQLTIGSAADTGNLLQALKLDTASIQNNGASGYAVTSSGSVSGINVGSTFTANNNAGYATAVTAGTFTINGVQITVSTNQNTQNVIDEINSSNAGVIASYNATTGQISFANKATGSQGILLGSASDSSNFLQAAGFLQNYQTPGTLASGASQVVGQAAQVQYTDPSGVTHTAYSASNSVTNVIPGIQMNLTQPTNVSGADVPYTVNVAQDSSALQSAITTFVNAYNAVIGEINKATQAPVVGSTTDSSTGQTAGAQLTTGGVLFNNQDILSLRDQLVNLISSFASTGSANYNSLASIGLQLDSSFTVAAATSSNSDSSDSSSSTTTNSSTGAQDTVTTQTYQGTSGQLQALNVSTLQTALAANPSAVQNLFVGATSIIGQLGSYLTNVTGLPTMLKSGMAGSVPTQSLFATLNATTSDQIQSLQQQIQVVTNQANMQADLLRSEFVDSETHIAQLQAMQGSLGALTGKSG
jgi:flagellar hook-associated protein 2